MNDFAVSSAAASAAAAALGSGQSGLLLPPEYERVGKALERKSNVILFGPPGTGKTHAAQKVSFSWAMSYGNDSVFRTTFHPSYSYEDFVHGFRPRTRDPATYALRDGTFLQACAKGWEFLRAGQTKKRVLLMIDEINRADVARVFGELITYIERDKRGIRFNFAQLPDVEYAVPENLFILGTMNTADKSISLMDIALRRRFTFIGMDPDPSKFQSVSDWLSDVDGLDLGKLLVELNRRLLSQGVEPDRSIGHALLAISATSVDAKAELRDVLMEDIIPLVQEYFYMDRDRVRSVFGALVDEFGRPDESLDADAVVAHLASISLNEDLKKNQEQQTPVPNPAPLSGDDILTPVEDSDPE